MKINDKHYLEGDGISYKSCEKNKKKFLPNRLDTLVYHYDEWGDSDAASDEMCQPDLKKSAHLIIGRNGEIIQMVAFDTISWHAGESFYNGRRYLNQYSIGIELSNKGKLDENGGMILFPKNKVDEKEIFIDPEGHKWHKYTEKQLKALLKVSELIYAKYDIKFLLGHSDIAPGRKNDPGAAFPMLEFKTKLLGK